MRAKARMTRFEFDRLKAYTLHVRDGCCLYHRLPDGPHCINCPLLHEAERARRLEADLRAASG